MEKIKIVKVNSEGIYFDNGDVITCDHNPDCCEWNFADFESCKDFVGEELKPDLKFVAAKEYGFRFGNRDGKMLSVPCYSCQNGYYSTNVEIYLNGQKVLNCWCELKD